MGRTLVVGAGLAGCTAALELAGNGMEVVLLEKGREIGGKVRSYGCKAADSCTNCGLCIVGDLWERVLRHGNISIFTGARLLDISGSKGGFTAVVSLGGVRESIPDIDAVIAAIGFEEASSGGFGNLEIQNNDNINIKGSNKSPGNIITGRMLEELLSERNSGALLPEVPARVAFIQCFGSRDLQEKAAYCSRVCCGYSTRAAKVIRKYYPEIEIDFFYMDLQWVESGEYFNCLAKDNIRFIRSRPVKIKEGRPSAIVFENPETGRAEEKEYDLIVLSEGIRPPSDAGRLAELCTLGIDEYGFLRYVSEAEETGVYIAGCASGPKRIEETSAEALNVARRVLSQKQG